MRLTFINSTQTNPYFNLALEDAILQTNAENSVVLYLWQNFDTVVIGNGQNPWRECDINRISKDNVSLARRTSGGGAVFHDMGNLNFSIIADSKNYDEDKQADLIISALKSLGVKAEKTGRNDIVSGGHKISGNAFKHTKNNSLHHGTLLVSSQLDRLGAYLTPSKAKLEAKGVQSVRSRVVNISEVNNLVDIESMREALKKAFGQKYGEYAEISISDLDYNAQKIIAQSNAKFSSREWIYGKTVDFNMSIENKFEWGFIQIDMDVRKGNIQSLVVNSDAMLAGLSSDIESLLQDAEVEREAAKRIIERSKSPDISSQYRDILVEIAEWMQSVD